MLYEVITNKESLELTKKTGNSWFFSRSRNKLWMKGEESGNTQKIKEILVDCDFDAIIYLVEPRITSYNVCYTKLLRIKNRGKSGIFLYLPITAST